MNPYPKMLVDESSGVVVPNDRHHDWEEGYKAGIKEVVEFVNSNKLYGGNISIRGKDWQAKLKEWE